jgi:hypothetical protein
MSYGKEGDGRRQILTKAVPIPQSSARLPRRASDRRESIQVRTLFISSRMEEVAMERKAAYEAVFAEGLVPLMFEAAPDLGKADKERIDTLVDNADLFAGVYDSTLGSGRMPDYPHLSPLEYELYRFVFSAHIRRSGVHADQGRNLIAQWLAHNSPQIKNLRDNPTKCEFTDILRKRVRLYLTPGGQMEKRLAEFLKPFFVRILVAEPIPLANTGANPHFLPCHVTLHQRLRADIQRGRRDVFEVVPPSKVGLRVIARIRNEPGALNDLLDVVFSCNLNVLHIVHTPSATDHGVEVVAAPYSASHSRSCVAALRIALQGNRIGAGCKIETCPDVERIVARMLARKARQALGRSAYTLRFRTLQAPGILTTVLSRLARRRINIDRVRHVPCRPSLLGRIQIFEVGLNPSLKQRSSVDAFGFELPSIVGVVAAEVDRLHKVIQAPRSASSSP